MYFYFLHSFIFRVILDFGLSFSVIGYAVRYNKKKLARCSCYWILIYSFEKVIFAYFTNAAAKFGRYWFIARHFYLFWFLHFVHQIMFYQINYKGCLKFDVNHENRYLFKFVNQSYGMMRLFYSIVY